MERQNNKPKGRMQPEKANQANQTNVPLRAGITVNLPVAEGPDRQSSTSWKLKRRTTERIYNIVD